MHLVARALSDRETFVAPAHNWTCEMMTPIFANECVEVMLLMVDLAPEAIRDLNLCLSEDERRRAGGLRLERDRNRFIATRGRLRHLLASKLAIRPDEVELEYNPYGKPLLSRRMPRRGLQFSVSRSGEVAVIAHSKSREVGIDLEEVLPVPEADDIAALSFSDTEYRSYVALRPEHRLRGFLERWTRLEAISKAVGCGLGDAIPADEQEWTTHTFVPSPRYIGAVVVRN